jgi:hypothetical protein
MPPYEVHARYWLGRVALLAGDGVNAAAHFEQATTRAAQLGMAGWTDRCRAALHARGDGLGAAPG